MKTTIDRSDLVRNRIRQLGADWSDFQRSHDVSDLDGESTTMEAADGSKVSARRVKKNKFMRNMRELGVPGTVFSGGFLLTEDLNQKWRNLQSRIPEIHNMIRTDGTVRAAIMATTLPLLACHWEIEAPTGEKKRTTSEEQRIADFVQKNYDDMEQPFIEFLNQGFDYVPFGFSWFEKVFETRGDGQQYLKKLAQRLPETVSAWNTNRDGSLISVTQRLRGGDHVQQREITLSANRLLVLSHQKKGANYEGESILRSAYKHWYLKDKLERIDAIAHERHGVGIPVIEIPPGTNPIHMKLAEKILEDLRSHEKGYVIIPQGWIVRILEFKNTMRDPMTSIEYHDRKIGSSTLINFLNSGSSSGRQNAQASQSNFLLAVIQYHATYMGAMLDRHVNRNIIEFNFGEQERYPYWRITPTSGIDQERMARALMMLGQNRFVHVDEGVQDQIHDQFGLPAPDRTKKDINAPVPAAPPAKPGQPVGGNDQKKAPAPNPNDKADQKKVAEALQPFVDLQIESMMMHGADGKFRPPLEGTLYHAMLAPYQGDINRAAAQKAATEFSRRLSLAAEIGYSRTGDNSGAREQAIAEAERSMPFLVESIQPIERVEVTE